MFQFKLSVACSSNRAASASPRIRAFPGRKILTLLLVTGSITLAGSGLEDILRDFTSWTTNGTPVISTGAPGAFDDTRVEEPSAIQKGGKAFVFYVAWKSSYAGSIGVASGESLASLTKNPTPVLTASGSGWDKAYVSGPRVFYDNGIYYLYYFGSANSAPEFEAAPSSLGVATSTDLVHWTKYASNPILTPGSTGWDSHTLYRPFVLKWQRTFYLFYNASDGRNERIGYATAPTPLGPWTKYKSNPVMDIGSAGAWDSQRIGDPWIIRVSNAWVMYYYGGSHSGSPSMGLAYSTDLSSWTRYTDNPLSISGFTGRDIRPSVIQFGGRWLMLFDNGISYGKSGCAIFAAGGPRIR
jgi:predicted GH43/DUF377 family glycosyl hydrolase